MSTVHTMLGETFQELCVHFYQILADLEKFQDLVKEVAVCACRNILSEYLKGR